PTMLAHCQWRYDTANPWANGLPAGTGATQTRSGSAALFRLHRRAAKENIMDFNLPKELTDYLNALDTFIEQEIAPLQAADDNERFFDHRREWARTDFENDGLPRPEWEALMAEARQRA